MKGTTKFIINLFLNVLLTMAAIYVIKKTSKKYNIPVIKQISEEV